MSVTEAQIAHLKEHQAEFEEAYCVDPGERTIDEYIDEYDDSEHPDLYVGMCSDMGIKPREESPVIVTWNLEIDDARELWDYLHHNRPGGYQHVHDQLLEAIREAAEA
jgi:hypothetical protein